MKPQENSPAPSAPSFAISIAKRAVAAMLAPRGNDCNDPTGRLCEKPAASSTKITWIIVGTVVGVLLIGTLSILAFFHFRRQKRDKREDREDRFQMSDWGLEETPGGAPRGEEEIKWNPASAAAGAPGTDRGSPGYGRHARDPLQAGVEPKYTHGGPHGRAKGQLNPFDDTTSMSGSSLAPSAGAGGGQWPARGSSVSKGVGEEGKERI